MKQKPLALIFLLFSLRIFTQETERPDFYEFGSLHPQINNLDQLFWKEGRTLVFADYWREKIIITDTSFQKAATQNFILGIDTVLIGKAYWDFHTKQNFVGGFLLEKSGDGFQAKTVDSSRRNFAYPGDNRARIVMDNGDALTVTTAVKAVNDRRILTNELTVSSASGATLFHTEPPHLLSSVTWIGGDWIFMGTSPRAGGFGIRHYTIVNYRTREERSFYPEIIVGFGKNLVMTTSTDDPGITGKELTGITLWNLDNEIIYRDALFDLCGTIKGAGNYQSRGLGFCSVDLPYIYVPVYARSAGPVARVSYGILDLYKGRAYTAGFGEALLLGIFD
jgi:hypothetical protein